MLCEAAQSCPTLFDPMDCSPLGSSVHGISQARILEWVATPFSRGSSQHRDRTRSPALQADSLPSEPLGIPYIMDKSSWVSPLSCSIISDHRVAQMIKHLSAMRETQVQSLGAEDPWRRKWQPTLVFLPGKFHEQRSLAGYSPQACKESDLTE